MKTRLRTARLVLAEHGIDPATAATRPVEIPHPHTVEATGWARCTRVTDPLGVLRTQEGSR